MDEGIAGNSCCRIFYKFDVKCMEKRICSIYEDGYVVKMREQKCFE